MAGAVIRGWSTRLGRPFAERLETQIRAAVLEALSVAGLAIEDIDSVVTVASDTLDGLSVPGRGEIAGNYGRSYLNLPSSAGHGLGAAVTQIESGAAENLLLVGWGAATRLADDDFRANQADPFYARPIGATPRVVAALQAHEISGAEDPSTLQAYADEMFARAWQGEGRARERAAPAWAGTAFCDGAVALVLQREDAGKAGAAVRDFASVSRPYSPADESLDPAGWAKETVAALGGKAAAFGVLEAAAPTPAAEARALGAVSPAGDRLRFNRSGGGAAAWFGAATGLRQVAEASRSLAAGAAASGLVLDMAGPIGQHMTAILIEAGASA
jgi:hypothetical protein